MQLYFIAIIPPEAISEEVTSIKKSFSINHNSNRSLKSPPHITLRPPFKMFSQREEKLYKTLSEFAAEQKSFLLELNGFGHFRKDVIYIKPVKHSRLDNLFESLQTCLSTKNDFPPVSQYPAFNPHITVAYRDLSTKAFDEAWKIFEHKQFNSSFEINSIYLLKHLKQKWEIIHDYRFSPG